MLSQEDQHRIHNEDVRGGPESSIKGGAQRGKVIVTVVPLWPSNSIVPLSCSVSRRTNCQPSDSVARTSRSSGRPTPVSLTVRTQVPGGSCRRVTWISPTRPSGKACLKLFVISSVMSKPHGLSLNPHDVTVAGRTVRLKELLAQPGEVLGGVRLGHH
jgi:hypothetical protein